MTKESSSAPEGEYQVRRCVGCGLDKLVGENGEFPTNGSGGYRPSCRTCFNAYRRAKYGGSEGQTTTDDQAETGLIFDMAAFGTADERQAAEAMLRLGTIQAAAEELGVTPARLRATLGELQRRAASRGFSPGHGDATHTTPAGYHVKGISTQYGPGGEVMSQWVKSNRDLDNPLTMLIDAVAGIAEPFRGQSTFVPPPSSSNDDLLSVYTMGDPHLGMHSWFQETGHNFDLDVAESNLCAAVDHLVSLAPASKRALLIELGDFFHADSAMGTTTLGTKVDVDTRWAKVLGIGIRAMRRCIDRMLEKHEIVDVIIEIGNHDSGSAVMLALCLSNYYENNPRVHIDTSPAKFHWYRFGKCLIGVTHGDTVKFNELPQIMAVDRKKDWGETDHRHWYCGHVHHDSVKEFPGVTVETMRTLAPSDAWHAAKGYRSGQDMKLDVWHAERGRENRMIVGIRQLFDTRVEREIRSS